jgi:hypothetical protein
MKSTAIKELLERMPMLRGKVKAMRESRFGERERELGNIRQHHVGAIMRWNRQ